MRVTFAQGESFLKEVELREIPCWLTMIEEGGEEKIIKFRFLTPEIVGGR